MVGHTAHCPMARRDHGPASRGLGGRKGGHSTLISWGVPNAIKLSHISALRLQLQHSHNRVAQEAEKVTSIIYSDLEAAKVTSIIYSVCRQADLHDGRPLGGESCKKGGRGRDGGFSPPPAQIPAGGFAFRMTSARRHPGQ